MGEDRTTCTEKKPNEVAVVPSPCRHRHSSVISSCSEDAESESTSAGYPQSPDEERDEELEYGPGIVNKLRTRFLSITLKQNRGTNMRRSCSMENLLDQDRPCRENPVEKTNGCSVPNKMGNLKRAKSMDTLLMELNPDPPLVKEMNGDDKKPPKIIKRQDGGLNRLVPTICDEELPKPDTVKTYKRMFEPAESRRGSYCRRPPVLRASAKSCASSKTNGVSTSPSAKTNGTTTKSKYSAKQASPVRAQFVPDSTSTPSKKPVLNGEPSRPLYNGCHVVKANPVKIHTNNIRNSKDIEKNLNSINRLMNKKEVHFAPKTDIICNGNHKEVLKTKTSDEISKPSSKNVTNGVETVNSKPKVPPNRPNLKSPKPLLKIDEQKQNDKVSSKLKPSITNGYKNSEVDASAKSKGMNCKDEVKIDQDKKGDKSATENKQIKEVKKPVENVKDEVKLPTGNQEKAEVKPPPEVKQKARIPIPVDTPVKSVNPVKEDSNILENKNRERTAPETFDLKKLEKSPVVAEKKIPNGYHESSTKSINESEKSVLAKKESQDKDVKSDIKPVKKSASAPSTSMVFDFRGKDVVSHVAVLPVPFGCKGPQPKKRSILVDGKDVPNGNGTLVDEDDDDYVDYSVPAPSGVVFEGENVKIGRGSILSTRNKELKIKFDDDVDSNTFVYPSESSLLEDPERSLSPAAAAESETTPNGQHPPKLKTNTVIGSTSAGGLSTYTPSVLRTMENFEPGMFRPPPPDKEDEKKRRLSEEEENTDVREAATEEEDPDMLKPADPDIISSWSLSAGTSDLLF